MVGTLVAGVAAPAGAILWDGGGVNSQWIEPANWQFNQIPTTADTATIVNDTALITGYFAPPVFAVELGLGATQGGLEMIGTGDPARLEVVTSVTVANEGSLVLGGGGPAPSRVNAGSLSTSGMVSVLDLGTISLSGPFLQTAGTVAMSDGRLMAPSVVSQSGLFEATGVIDAAVTIGDGVPAGATLSPGAGIGELTINGGLQLSSDARLEVQFASTPMGDAFDEIHVSGAATLGGTLDLSAIGGAVPTPGVTYSFLTAGKVTGRFDEIIGAAVGNGSLIPQFDDLLNSVGYSYSELRGNMNGDDFVDEDDVELFAWAIRDEDTYHTDFFLNGFVAEAFMADMDLDGANTFADIPWFLEAVSQSGGNAQAALAQINRILDVVPEPPTTRLVLVMAALLISATQRRRRA